MMSEFGTETNEETNMEDITVAEATEVETPDVYVTQPILDITKVETLREKMLLSITDMAMLLGVARVTYYGWTRGNRVRAKNAEQIRALFRVLLVVVRQYGWPTADAINYGRAYRSAKIRELAEATGWVIPEQQKSTRKSANSAEQE
jgi:DNA-binding transcriptional regulator YiaG